MFLNCWNQLCHVNFPIASIHCVSLKYYELQYANNKKKISTSVFYLIPTADLRTHESLRKACLANNWCI